MIAIQREAVSTNEPMLSNHNADVRQTLATYEQTLAEVERMYAQLRLEERADFLAEKQAIYEEAVSFCIAANLPERGLVYAERIRSLASLDPFAAPFHTDLQPNRQEDAPLVAELLALRSKRDRLYQRWSGTNEGRLRGGSSADPVALEDQQEILALEQQISTVWHTLLRQQTESGPYSTEMPAPLESVQQFLPPQSVLLQYFVIKQEIVVFVVSSNTVAVQRLHCDVGQVQRLLQLLQLNLYATLHNAATYLAQSIGNAQGLLRHLYNALLAPVRSYLPANQGLIIAPYGPLHNLPFHALFDGQRYLVEDHEISYLPGASLLRYAGETEKAANGALVYGNSQRGQLPYTLHEAHKIAQIIQVQAKTEVELNLSDLRQSATDCRIIHLATHGEFRPDNPLFSGLMIGDEWLTTLDIFNLRLRASLVTLSACQTGCNVVQSGDKLVGLMRALLTAGALSLVLSLWPVEDQRTAQFMEHFYAELAAGASKGAALRAAQLHFIQQPNTDENGLAAHRHPYFWASFFLVGDAGEL